jgi:hypothetical protein
VEFGPPFAGRGEVEFVAAAGLAGIDLVLDPVVGAGVEVAARARHRVVARRLQIPEHRLAEDDGRLLVGDEVRQVGRLRYHQRVLRRWLKRQLRVLLRVDDGHRDDGRDVERAGAGNQAGRLRTDAHGPCLLVLHKCGHDGYWTCRVVEATVVAGGTGETLPAASLATDQNVYGFAGTVGMNVPVHVFDVADLVPFTVTVCFTPLVGV